MSLVPPPRSIRWPERLWLILTKSLADPVSDVNGVGRRVEEQPVVGKVDRVRRASRRDQDVGVGELQDLDVGQRVGAVAAGNVVRDRRLTAGVGRDRVLAPCSGEDRDVAAAAAVDGVVAAAADEGVAVAVCRSACRRRPSR